MRGTGGQKMTVQELKDYLSKYTGEGKGDTPVVVCRLSDNPLEIGKTIEDIVFQEWIDGECTLVIQIGSFKDGK
jgi:hypothetical protein